LLLTFIKLYAPNISKKFVKFVYFYKDIIVSVTVNATAYIIAAILSLT
jgi:hypothetical protein